MNPIEIIWETIVVEMIYCKTVLEFVKLSYSWATNLSLSMLRYQIDAIIYSGWTMLFRA
jgi:hypothetical protein